MHVRLLERTIPGKRARSSTLGAAVAAAGLLFAACEQSDGSPNITAAPSSVRVATAVPPAATATATSGGPATPPAGLESSLVADLASKRGIPGGGITLVAFEAALWPDGCLGLGAGNACSQALVPGWLAVLRAPDGTEYRYRGAGTRFELEP